MLTKHLFVMCTCCAILSCASYNSAWGDVLDFEDADGVNWNGNLYGEPVFGPGETAPTYHGFTLNGWRVFSMDGRGNGGGVFDIYGTASYIYKATLGDRCIHRTSYDPQSISRLGEDFYFVGARIAATDSNGHDNPSTVRVQGYKAGQVVWTEQVIFDSDDDGVAFAIDYISSYANVAVDQVEFHAWEYYNTPFALDSFTYTPEPTSLCLLIIAASLLLNRRAQ